MPVESAEDLAVFFNPEEFGQPALYTGADSAPVSLSVVRRHPSVTVPYGGGRLVADSDTVQICASDVARPRDGDTLQIGSEKLLIVGEPLLDASGSVWTCTVEPA